MNFESLLKRAEQGDAKSELELAKNYYNGRGVNKDYNEAFKWFYEAANDGIGEAEYYIANCYYEGIGTEKSYRLALDFFLRAEKHYYMDVCQRILDCKKNLNLV